MGDERARWWPFLSPLPAQGEGKRGWGARGRAVATYDVVLTESKNSQTQGMSMMKLERLDHFGIEVAELKRAERFYTEVLGLSVVARFGDQVLLLCGDQNLALFQVPRTPLTPGERQNLISHPLGKGHHAFRGSRADL